MQGARLTHRRAGQVREAAASAGVRLGGENALPCFSPAHADAAALDRIVYNTRAWLPPLQARRRPPRPASSPPPSSAGLIGGR